MTTNNKTQAKSKLPTEGEHLTAWLGSTDEGLQFLHVLSKEYYFKTATKNNQPHLCREYNRILDGIAARAHQLRESTDVKAKREFLNAISIPIRAKRMSPYYFNAEWDKVGVKQVKEPAEAPTAKLEVVPEEIEEEPKQPEVFVPEMAQAIIHEYQRFFRAVANQDNIKCECDPDTGELFLDKWFLTPSRGFPKCSEYYASYYKCFAAKDARYTYNQRGYKHDDGKAKS